MVEEEERPHWWLMVLVAGFDGSGKRRWTLVAVAGSGKVADRGDGGCRVVMGVEVDIVDGGGDKEVVVMGSSVEETALAVFAVGGLDATALAVWVGERGRRRERRWTLLVVVVVAGRGDDDARRMKVMGRGVADSAVKYSHSIEMGGGAGAKEGDG